MTESIDIGQKKFCCHVATLPSPGNDKTTLHRVLWFKPSQTGLVSKHDCSLLKIRLQFLELQLRLLLSLTATWRREWTKLPNMCDKDIFSVMHGKGVERSKVWICERWFWTRSIWVGRERGVERGYRWGGGLDEGRLVEGIKREKDESK